MEPRPQTPSERDLHDLLGLVTAESTRLDAVTKRVDALEIEVPLGHVELREEIDVLEARLEALLARLARLEAAEPAEPTAARQRGVIGALRVERPAPDDDATPD